MSRISTIEQLYARRKSALEFNYDSLSAPPIRSIFTQQDINELTRIATSIKYNANIDLKYELIDAVMISRGFRKAHAGTNRVVYNYLEDPTFVAKVAVDRVGMGDTPAEFKNQEFIKPFCCKIFEVTENGVLGFVERVNPVSSLEEFLSISDDIFNLMITKIIGKYVVADLSAKKFMNFGVRENANGYTFGPVVIDFPYVYELDDKKLICANMIETPNGEIPCGGEIDYTDDLDQLVCNKCGKKYKARDLAKPESKIKTILKSCEGEYGHMRARLVDGNGNVISDSGRSSKTYVSKDLCRPFNNHVNGAKSIKVVKTTRRKRVSREQIRNRYYSKLATEYYNERERQREEELKGKEIIKVKSTNKYADKETQNISNNISEETKKYVVEIVPKHLRNVEENISNNIEEETVNEETMINDSVNVSEESVVEESIEPHEEVEEHEEENYEDNQDQELSINTELLANAMVSNDNEIDYSNYQVEETDDDEQEDEEECYESFEEYNKTKQKEYKRMNKHNDDDMSEY